MLLAAASENQQNTFPSALLVEKEKKNLKQCRAPSGGPYFKEASQKP